MAFLNPKLPFIYFQIGVVMHNNVQFFNSSANFCIVVLVSKPNVRFFVKF